MHDSGVKNKKKKENFLKEGWVCALGIGWVLFAFFIPVHLNTIFYVQASRLEFITEIVLRLE